MPGSFEDALAQNPAPKRVGDVTLRYEPSLLIGEGPRTVRGLGFTTVILLGIGAGLGTLGGLIVATPTWAIAALLLATAACFGAATVLDQRARRQRRFVLNFGTSSLRLDFSSPFDHRPRTMIVHFDGVRDCALYEQGNGNSVLTVDFVTSAASQDVLREVLVANIASTEEEAAQRLLRVLTNAFGLGEKPPSPAEPPPPSAREH